MLKLDNEIKRLEALNVRYKNTLNRIRFEIQQILETSCDNDLRDVVITKSYQRKLANTDPTTNLLNLKEYERRIADAIKYKLNVTVIAFDLNGLKCANDIDYKWGDKLLATFAGALCSVFPYNTVYRVGGDEFVALFENEPLRDGHNVNDYLDKMDIDHEKNCKLVQERFVDLWSNPAHPVIKVGFSYGMAHLVAGECTKCGADEPILKLAQRYEQWMKKWEKINGFTNERVAGERAALLTDERNGWLIGIQTYEDFRRAAKEKIDAELKSAKQKPGKGSKQK